MGAKCVKFFAFYLCSICICIEAFPVEKGADTNEFTATPAETKWPQLLAVAFTVTCVLVLLGCLSCCKQRAGFKKDNVEQPEFRNSVSESNVNSVGLDFVNPLQNVQPSRYSIFSSIVEATIEKQPESIVTFEPLPKVLPTKFTSNVRLPQFSGNAGDIGFIEEWLGEKDFPRQQLHYLRECGQGWFGKVVEGEARGILPSSNKVCRVIVRILKEDATAVEQAYFLQEAKPYKDLSHPNVLKLLGRCLENVPFLLVFETCANGDLKSYLRQNVGNRDALIFQGIILRMAVDAASGLSYMLQHSFVLTDIAARNCLVTGDLRVKVGDYGTSLHQYKDEYYINGDIALPIRWCAPETLNCSDTCIEPKPVSGTSCIWSYGVLLWELEEWGELPYRELTNDQVITKVFGEGYRLPFPSNRTPYSQEMYNIMQECWKDYVDRPSFIHVMNALSALMHRFKNNDFESRWQSSKPNTIPVVDNADKLSSRLASLSSKADNDSGIDLDHPGRLRGLSMSQLQQSVSRQRIMNDELSSESPASSRRFSGSSTGDLFSSPVSMKHRSPSLENLHGSLDNMGILGRRISGDEVFGSSSSDYWPKERRGGAADDEECAAKLDFQLGLVSRSSDASIIWNDKPLFQTDSYLEDTSLTKRADSLGTDAEEELWRKRIERGEFTEKVKEKSKSVADLMVLTHIECSESSESDSLPSFHSRQSSFNRHSRKAPKLSSNAPLSLFNSLSFGSESNLPAVEKDNEFQEALKKIQIAKMTGEEESLNLVSLQANSLVGREDSGNGGGASGKIGNHFLANEASEKRSTHYQVHSSHVNSCSNAIAADKAKLPLFDNSLFQDAATAMLEKRAPGDGAESNLCDEAPGNVEPKVLVTESSCVVASAAPPTSGVVEETYAVPTEEELADSVVIGPSECDTLEYFVGLKTTLVDEKLQSPTQEAVAFQALESSPQTLNEFLQDSNDDYFYKCGDGDDQQQEEVAETRSGYCEYCYAKCHFSNECLRCKDKSLEENCSCESFENLEKYRDCATLNSCLFQSDDSGRGTDQINSGDGSSDKSLEGSISVQMNEVKNRLEDVIAKFAVTDELSDDNCSSLEDDKDTRDSLSVDSAEEFLEKVKSIGAAEVLEAVDDVSCGDELQMQVFEAQGSHEDPEVEDVVVTDDAVVLTSAPASRRDSLLAISEENDNSASFEEDTCIGTGMGSSNSGKWSEDGGSESESDMKDEGAEEEDEKSSSSRTFVKVEQLFFTVDPKFEREYEAELSKSESFSKFESSLSECSSMNFNADDANEGSNWEAGDVKLQVNESETVAMPAASTIDAAVALPDEDDSGCENRVEYEISDILEGLSEPISLPYSVNRPAEETKATAECEDATATTPRTCTITPPPSLETGSVSSGWLPSPIDEGSDDESFGCKRALLEMDETFVEAIRNELREKLPNTSTLAIVEPEEWSEPESTNITIEYNSFPAQLSPILEEEEDCSVASSLSSSSNESETLNGGYDAGDDLLVVNVDTNEASLLDTGSAANTLSSPLFQQHQHNLNETYDIVDENDDTIGFTDPLDSDSFPSPDSLSPGTSSKTGAHLSYSSSDCGNLSDVFLSPSSSSKNFEDFDTDRTAEEGRHLNTPENVLQSDSRDEYQKAILNIDEMLKKSERGPDELSIACSTLAEVPDEATQAATRNERSESWLKSFFTPVEETASMVEFESCSSLGENEFRSLPADFKSENWPAAEELVLSQEEVAASEEPSNELDTSKVGAETATPEPASKAVVATFPLTTDVEATSNSGSNCSAMVTSTPAKEMQLVPVQSVKQKNSIALFGNTCKQIRNFQVSVVEDDCFAKARTSPTSPKTMDVYFGERLLGTSPKHSEKTWKTSSPSLNSFLGSQNLETLGLKELNVGDMMSTSFIESGSQDGSVDGKDENQPQSDSEDDDDDGVESTCDEFVWKKNDETFEVIQNNDKKTDCGGGKEAQVEDEDDDDDDDEELTDFVPFSWNSDAIPQRSALKNRDRLRTDKKNVSFKKQKYHCVYEYPKEEPNYSRRYDTMLQERMLNFLNLNQDYLYNDYSSFSDWELDDCEEQPPCGDDLLPYPISPALSSKTNLSNKLGFYTIGAYDLDSSTKADDVSSNFVNSNSASSPTIYSIASPTIASAIHGSIDGGEKNGAVSQANDRLVAGKHHEFSFDNVKLPNAGDKSTPSPTDSVECGGDLPSPGLGELRHAKGRLKLDLGSRTTTMPVLPKPEPVENLQSSPEKRSPRCEPEMSPPSRVHRQPDDSELLEENSSDDFVVDDFGGLNYAACDISPVVELKSLTSTSVA